MGSGAGIEGAGAGGVASVAPGALSLLSAGSGAEIGENALAMAAGMAMV